MFKLIKEHKYSIIFSSLLILAPTIAGIFLWDKLPDNMAINFGTSNISNQLASKSFTIFFLPLLLLLLQWLCLFFTSLDSKNKNQNKKAFGIVFWIIPIISILVNSLIYSVALGKKINIEPIMVVFFSLMFIIIGNYLPKISQNFTLGLKITWTLNSEENWNKTHRFSGKLWVVGGFVLLLSLLLPENFLIPVILVDLLAMVIFPIIYSYSIYRKEVKNGTYKESKVNFSKPTKIFSIIVLSTILILVGILMFTGNVNVSFTDTNFTVKSTYYGGVTANYSDIDSIKLINNDDIGVRTNGFASARLNLGLFENDEFGLYTRYTYVGNKSAIVLKDGDEILVLNGKDEVKTKEIYEKLLDRLN